MTLEEAIGLRDAAHAAYLKSLEALSYQAGTGTDVLSLQRNTSDRLKAEFLDWDRRVTAMQANPSGRRSRLSYIGPQR